MKRIYVVLVSLVMMVLMTSMIFVTAVAEEKPYIKIGDYNETVLALHQKLADIGYYSLRPESPWNEASADALKILQFNIDMPMTGVVESREQLNNILELDSVIGKNLLADTDFYIEKDSTSTDVISKSFGLKPDVDLQSLIGRTVTLSIYVNSPGERGTSVEDQGNYMADKFGCHLIIKWADSTGICEDKISYPCTDLLSQSVVDARISSNYPIAVPAGYDCIKELNVSVQSGARPSTETLWSLGYPKLEFGKIATEWQQ